MRAGAQARPSTRAKRVQRIGYPTVHLNGDPPDKGCNVPAVDRTDLVRGECRRVAGTFSSGTRERECVRPLDAAMSVHMNGVGFDEWAPLSRSGVG